MARKEIKKYLIQNFGGSVRNDTAPIYLNDTQLPEALNIDFSLERGAARKRKGYLRMNAGTGLNSAVTGIFQVYLNGAWRNLVCAGTMIYHWNQTTDSAADITSAGMTTGKNYLYDFTTFVASATDCIFFAHDHQDVIKKWDGTTFASVDFGAHGDSDWDITNYYAKCIATFNNYLFTANTKEDANTFPERVRYSKIGNAENNDDDTNLFDVFTTAGKEIRRIMPLRDLLIVYKEDSIWAIYYTGDSTAPFGLTCIDYNMPCIAGFSVADVKGEHFFLSEEGIMRNNGAKVDPVLVSKNVQDWFRYISRTNWQYGYAATNEYMKQYRLLIPFEGGTDVSDKDREVRYDYENNTWSVHKYAGDANVVGTMVMEQAGTWDTIARYWDEIFVTWEDPELWSRHTRFFTGDYNGYFRMHDQVERDQEATDQAIDGYLITKPLNLSESPEDIMKNKRLNKARIRFKSYNSSFANVYYRRDRKGAFILAGTVDLDRPEREFIASLDLSGNCKEVEYKIQNNAALQPFCAYDIGTEFLLRSER